MSSGNIPAKPLKQQENKRQYQRIWETIREKQPGEVTQVRCHPSAVKRIIQAVKKEKTGEIAVKRRIGFPCAGPLEIAHNPEFVNGKPTGMVLINFKLSWDGSKL